MRTRFPEILSGMVLLVVWAAVPSLAEEKIQAVVTSTGRIVFTNLVDNAPAPLLPVKTESNFNRWAVSNKGARGLMQLIPATGARYGVRDFFDPQQNVEGGVQYLKFLLEKFKGNLDLSLAAYNAGENLVQRLGRIPPIPETTNYVRRVRANYTKRTAPIIAPAPPVKTAEVRAHAPAVPAAP